MGPTHTQSSLQTEVKEEAEKEEGNRQSTLFSLFFSDFAFNF